MGSGTTAQVEEIHAHCLLPLADAQREMADDWAAAYDRYVLHDAVTSSLPTAPATIAQRLKAAARRISRAWIVGPD